MRRDPKLAANRGAMRWAQARAQRGGDEAGRRTAHMRARRLLATTALCLAGWTGAATAEVERFEITRTLSPAFEGQTFGATGAYERIDGIAHLAIDPLSERGRRIVDLDKATPDADGLVRYSTEVSILRPVEAATRSDTLLYEVPNRGRNLMFNLFNLANTTAIPETAGHAGDGHLMAQGYTLVWSGWQGDLTGELIKMALPVLPDVTGISREEFVFDKAEAVSTATLTYPAADEDPAKASLSVRLRPEDPRSTVAGLSFRYLSPTSIEITRPEGLDAGAIYEFIYPAKDAVPAGLAMAATSDVVSWLRGNPGHAAEPVVTGIGHTIGIGISQSGRFLRDLIHHGFNADEGGARVFDGAIPHIAGSRKTFTNARFAQPGRYSRQHEDHDVYGDQFPFSYAETTDPLSGQSGSILSACGETDTCPKVMHTDTSTEFWQARAALVSTAPDGTPLEMPETVRLYFMSGAPHFKAWSAASGTSPVCRNPTNPLSAAPVMRGLLQAMRAWVSDGTPPPDSRFPSLADGTLVPLDELNLPALGGEPVLPVYNVLKVRDHSVTPPLAGPAYPVLVPQVDADGIPQGGIEDPLVAVPLGTYWGWNLRAEGYAGGGLCGLEGSFLPFAVDAPAADGDARAPLAARYADEAAYLAALQASGAALVEAGLMLEADIATVLDKGRAAYAAVTGAK